MCKDANDNGTPKLCPTGFNSCYSMAILGPVGNQSYPLDFRFKGCTNEGAGCNNITIPELVSFEYP